jgi:hypothetical protein
MSLGYLSSVWSVMVIVASISASILVYTVVFPTALYTPVLIIAGVVAVLFIVRGVRRKDFVSGLFFAMWTIVAALFLISMQARGSAGDPFIYILFGVSLIGVGMLSHTGNNVSMDTFGPIADNANGIGELAKEDFLAGSAADHGGPGRGGQYDEGDHQGDCHWLGGYRGCLALWRVLYGYRARLPADRMDDFERVINLADPTVFVGLLIGGALPLLFGGLLIKAVNRAAGYIMAEVRRQLRIPAIMSGEQTPDYAKAVTISTRAAQSELIPSGADRYFLADCGRAAAERAGVGRLFGRGDPLRAVVGRLYGERWRGVGQRQEIHRRRSTTVARGATIIRRRWWATRSAIR